MLQFLLIGIVELLFLHHLLHLLLLLSTVVVFNHHDSSAFIVPGGLGLLLSSHTFLSDEEGSKEGAVDHHDVALDSEETRVVGLSEVEEAVEAFDAFLELILELINILLLLLLELLVLDILIQLDAFKFLLHLTLFLNFLCRLPDGE